MRRIVARRKITNRLVSALRKALKERDQLQKEKKWLINQLESVTYGGVPISPPNAPFGATWAEAATYACLPEEEKKKYKTNLLTEVLMSLKR